MNLKRVISVALLLLAATQADRLLPLVNAASDLPPLPAGNTWKLVWSDEFDGNSLDTNKWNTPGPQSPRGTGIWSDSKIKVSGGVLQFEIARENGKLVSAAISSQHHFETTYGYWEMRAKMPRAPGYRPTMFLQSSMIDAIGNTTHPTEIDVLEYPGRSGVAEVNLNWNGYGRFHQTTGSIARVSSPTDFHVYGVWWNETGYHFYLDGKPTWSSAAGGISSGPEFIKLGNDLIQKDMAHAPASFPANDNFTVDYVRVYKVE